MSLGLRSSRLKTLIRTFIHAASAATLFAPLLLLGSPAHGQSFVSAAPPDQSEEYTAPPPEPVPAAQSLAFSLAGAARPAGIAIAVDAEHTGLPQSSALPPRGASVLAVSRAFGRLTRLYGKVLAIAPPTMIVLNSHPAGENVYLGMQPAQVFRLLVASLDDAGWDALTGERGLGVANLATAEEQAMFTALFPSGSLEVAAKNDVNGGPDLARLRELPASALRSSHIRLARETRILLPASAAGVETHVGTDTPTRVDAPQEYVAMPGPPPEEQAGFFAGVALRPTVPNTAKHGQLDLKNKRFSAMIPLKDLHTVGELVARIAARTRTEIYADQRLERLSLVTPGVDDTASARSLLGALALCVSGTYRNLGPAFVLTDDLVGLGTRCELLHLWVEKVVEERSRALAPVDKHLGAFAARLAALRYAPDSQPITTGEMQFQPESPRRPAYPNVSLNIPLAALPQDQQDEARRMYESMKADEDALYTQPYYRDHPELLASAPRVSLQGDIEIDSFPALQLDVPNLDGPVDLDDYLGVRKLVSTISNPGNGTMASLSAAGPPAPDDSASGDARLLSHFRRRVCLAAPKSIAELDSILDDMAASGLNELWMVAPGPGAPRKPGDPTPGQLVVEAVTRGRQRGISILPVMSLLSWSPTAPDGDLDYTVLGQTYADVLRGNPLRSSPPGEPAPDAVVNPFSPDVLRSLGSLEKAIAVPGIAGVVWRHITAPGYDNSHPGTLGDPQRDLGYQRDARLLFLRQFHVDPVDIQLLTYYHHSVSEPPPLYQDPILTPKLQTQWREYLAAGNLALLRSLRAALGTANSVGGSPIPTSAPLPPVLIEAPGDVSAYVEWDDFSRIPFLYRGRDTGDVRNWMAMSDTDKRTYLIQRQFELTARAITESHTREALLPVASNRLRTPQTLWYALEGEAQQREWSGVVLDFSPMPAASDHPARTSGEILHRFFEMLHPPHDAAAVR